jgi:antitoxin YefM
MPMRLKISEDVIPVTDLRQNSAKILARLRKSKRPIVISQRGRPAAILESVEEYEKRLERLEFFEKVNRGIEAADRGELIDHRDAMRRLKEVVGG